MLFAALLALSAAGTIAGDEVKPAPLLPAPFAREAGARVAPTVPRQADTFAEARAEVAFVPPLPRRAPVAAAAEYDRVPAAPLLAMLVSMLVLLVAAVPQRVLANVGLGDLDRVQAVALVAGCAGLLIALGLLLSSA